jgi:hypothetical protein
MNPLASLDIRRVLVLYKPWNGTSNVPALRRPKQLFWHAVLAPTELPGFTNERGRDPIFKCQRQLQLGYLPNRYSVGVNCFSPVEICRTIASMADYERRPPGHSRGGRKRRYRGRSTIIRIFTALPLAELKVLSLTVLD